MLPFAPTIGTAVWDTFGSTYKLKPNEMVAAALSVAGTKDSRAYRIARQLKGVDDRVSNMRGDQMEAFKSLLATSHGLLARAGSWGRDFVEKTIASADEQTWAVPKTPELRQIRCR